VDAKRRKRPPPKQLVKLLDTHGFIIASTPQGTNQGPPANP
jgi:hypothetical protein